MIALIASVLLSANAVAAPKIDSAFVLPSTHEVIYEDQENKLGDPATLYYIPQRVKIARSGDIALWTFVANTQKQSYLNFSVVLVQSETLEKKEKELQASFAKKYSIQPEEVFFKPVFLDETSIEIFLSPDLYDQAPVIPEPGILLPAELQFGFLLNFKGENWFRTAVLSGNGSFGRIKGKVNFFNSLTQAYTERRVGISLSLRDVPYCAMEVIDPCKF